MARKNKMSKINLEKDDCVKKTTPVVVVEAPVVAGHATCPLHTVRFWRSWSTWHWGWVFVEVRD